MSLCSVAERVTSEEFAARLTRSRLVHLDRIEQEDKNIVTLELAGLTKKDVELSLHE